MIHRASGLGGCLLAQVAVALGHQPAEIDEVSRVRMAQGQLHEDDVVAILRAEGAEVTRQQEAVFISEDGDYGSYPASSGPQPGWVLEGHLDGVILDDLFHGPRVLEIKSMGKSAFAAFKSKGWDASGLIDRYKWQLSVYMLATGLEALVIAKSRDSGELLRHGIETPFHSLDEITARVAYLEDHIARQVLPDTCPHDFFCGFKRWCPSTNSEAATAKLGAPTSSLPELEVDTTTQLALSQYYLLGEKIKGLLSPVAAEVKALEKARDELKPLLKAGLADVIPNQKYHSGDYEVTWVSSEVKASTRSFAKVTKKENDAATT